MSTIPRTIALINESVSTERHKSGHQLNNWDVSVVVVYFAIVIATGFYAMYKSNRGTISGYFLAGRYMFWLPVGASVFASNIGSEHFIGLAGAGAASGLGVGAFEFNALLILQIAGWIFLPVFIASRVCTLPEYMFKRFGGRRISTYLAILSLILYIFTKISVNLYSGGIFIQQAFGWDLYISILILLIMTSICTVTGGLTAVIYMDTFQCFLMLTGAGILAVMAYIEVGGYKQLQDKYMKSVATVVSNNLTSCAAPNKHAFQMLRAVDDPDMPWLGFLLGQTPASIWYWCTDQMMVQRLLAAKSLSHTQGATLFAGYLKILPLFFIVIPGMISRVLYTEEVACADPTACLKFCNNAVSCTNSAYPRLVMGLMPSPLKGLMLAVMLAALMSDLTSIFNSASTLFTCDIWPRFRKNAPIRELMIVGRFFVIVMVLVSIIWIPVIQEMQGGQLFIYIQDVSANLAPPIAAVYIMAILWKRMNESGAFWALVVGLFVGLLRMSLNMIYREPHCGEEDTRPFLTRNLQYMYFAILLFWLTVITAVIVSYMTEPVKQFRLIRTTYWTRFDNRDRDDDKENLELKRAHQINANIKKSSDLAKECMKDLKKQNIKKLYNWFCGIDYSPKNMKKEQQFYEHLADIASIYQSQTSKTILNIFLVLVIIIALILYTYFSLPIHLQQTIL